jgi:hypothetical protein
MKENNQDRRKGLRRRAQQVNEVPIIVIKSLSCSVCGQTILEMPSAVAFGPEQGPAHFDCVIQALQDREELKPGEKIAYLGSGVFGVIIETQDNFFQIVKKILVEDPHSPPEWRKEIKAMVKQRTALPS